MASGLNLSGLASGIDTSTIIDQLMAIERQPQTRMKLKLSQSDARKQALADVVSRLKNLQTAARDLKSPTLWSDTQTLDVNDATKVSATRLTSTAGGNYQLKIDQLARGSQRWFTYTTRNQDRAITWSNGDTTNIAANSTIDDAVAAINADAAAPAYAAAVTDGATGTQYIVLSSKATGATAGAFTASGLNLTENAAKAVAGLDAKYSVNGGATLTSSTNVVTDAIPGLSLTLKGVTTTSGPVSINVGAPGADTAAISAKVKAFVEQYNSTLDFIRSKLDEKKVKDPATTADALKGSLYGDTMLEGVLSQMRIALTSEYASGNPVDLDQLMELGVSTGAATGAAALNADSVKGKLTFDAAKFSQAMSSDPVSVRKLLGGDSTVPGFAQGFDNLLTPTLQAGGTMDQRISSEDANKKRINDQIARMDTQLSLKEALLKRQFAAMETALQASQAQGQWLSGQLAGLQSS